MDWIYAVGGSLLLFSAWRLWRNAPQIIETTRRVDELTGRSRKRDAPLYQRLAEEYDDESYAARHRWSGFTRYTLPEQNLAALIFMLAMAGACFLLCALLGILRTFGYLPTGS